MFRARERRRTFGAYGEDRARPPATDAVGNNNCYGVGDYTGLAPTPDGVIADWPTTVGVQTSYVDSDIAVR